MTETGQIPAGATPTGELLARSLEASSSGGASLFEFSLQIGEFARFVGISTTMVRHYDGLGLLDTLRDANDHRVFTSRDLIRVEVIRALTLAGIKLTDTRRFLTGDLNTRVHLPAEREAIRRQSDFIRYRIEALRRTLDHIESGIFED